MIYFDEHSRKVEWSQVKSRRLKQTRGKDFGEVLEMRRLCDIEHPSRPGQALILFLDHGRVWVVPCVVKEDHVFLKTLYASRKYTAKYERGELK
jgi:hypothetical protein